MPAIIHICNNAETVFSGSELESRPEEWRDALDSVTAAAEAVVDAAGGIETKFHSQFRDWHGGKFCQFYDRMGLCAVAKETPKWLHDLANRADDAMRAAIAEAERQLAADDAEFAAQNADDGDEDDDD